MPVFVSNSLNRFANSGPSVSQPGLPTRANIRSGAIGRAVAGFERILHPASAHPACFDILHSLLELLAGLTHLGVRLRRRLFLTAPIASSAFFKRAPDVSKAPLWAVSSFATSHVVPSNAAPRDPTRLNRWSNSSPRAFNVTRNGFCNHPVS